MSRRIVLRFTCDDCGAQKSTTGQPRYNGDLAVTDSLPEGWTQVHNGRKPRRDLCAVCGARRLSAIAERMDSAPKAAE